METAGGNRIDIVSRPDEAVSPHYLIYSELPRLFSRAKELGISVGVPPTAFRVLVSENLIKVNPNVIRTP